VRFAVNKERIDRERDFMRERIRTGEQQQEPRFKLLVERYKSGELDADQFMKAVEALKRMEGSR
jgi:uncharacterized membrane protein